jgi:uncharacterized membrane protein
MKKFNPQNVFPLIIFVFGLLLIFITPIGAGFDEDTHLARIWEMSKGVLVPNEYLSSGPNYPYAFYQLSYRQDVNLEPVSWEAFLQQFQLKIDWGNFIDHQTRSVYFPTLYIVQAFILGLLGRVFNVPVAIIYYLLRFSYLIEYILLCYVAIKIIPKGKWLLGAISVLPMAMIQASIISPDGISNAICFLFLAWVVYLVQTPVQPGQRGGRRTLITGLVIFLLTTAKLNCIPYLLLLFLIPNGTFSKKATVILIMVSLLCLGFVCFGWNLLTSGNSGAIGSAIVDPTARIAEVLSQPGKFIAAMGTDFKQNFIKYAEELVGVSGYGYWKLPLAVYYLLPLLLLAVAVFEPVPQAFTLKQALVFLLVAGTILVLTSGIFYLLYSDGNVQQINGIQGRYFIIVLPLVFSCFQFIHNELSFYKPVAIITTLVALLTTVVVFFFDYHLICGDMRFSSEEYCYLPRYKNWAPEGLEKLTSTELAGAQQTFVPLCDAPVILRFWVDGLDSAGYPVNIRDVETHQLVGQVALHGIADSAPGWVAGSLDGIVLTRDKPYLLEFLPGKDDSTSAVHFYHSVSDEYTDGEFSLQGQGSQGDLLFQYGCIDW